ncbi:MULTISPECIES: malonate decarboxylase holo-ACP synthase [Pseudomonas aeruginosa group]|uniref:malonate decarboxylase holo-ACP synthase n=1 Tax=Pseudomonas aeruginosa group TaxID=136841 RepID=UPI0009A2D3EA|nr:MULTISPECIES: malonate decarboxylase holo-ACP synthase [Pseudomonas aeruginosa group]AVR65646.1 malonate decarboxylase holo-ACP synthase [Pseudomonas paraeruginosa]KAB0738980.1 malonate decarboxylase holo-ACP synthase [Pseudomonas aeruginosa]MBG3907175.1 malonate decarboxylase holo-ACP synthase [Pseudomonas aeruginosa]MBG4068718.1 malonate decarboxylase holo-ACP synthase [Pseudomonas aeruginosa]MBG4200469.1 malonate decarboxylase holo-ACP synthase [Pseudomonas aeruginosa]
MVIANSSQRGSSRRRLAPVPMREASAPEPHDLLLGMAPEHLADDAPPWAREVLAAGWPVVVRRAPGDPATVAIGVRGPAREQRWAGWMPLAAITRRLRPEALCQREPPLSRDLPAWSALRQLRAPLNALGLAWGVIGGAGFELASGVAVLHPDSDLDLLLRTPRPFPRDDALRLLRCFEHCPCRIDLQLQTPAGGVALREWAEGRPRVLAKGVEAPVLLEDPWRVAEIGA